MVKTTNVRNESEILKEKIDKVNQLLAKGEPDNISVDPYTKYIGYSPQSIVDAMNEVFGVDGWGFEEISNEFIGELAVANVKAWVGTATPKTAYGQSRITRGDIGDAKKGAQTDALKKALSYFSIGKRAYLGLLEEEPEKLVRSYRRVPAREAPTASVSSDLATEGQKKLIYALTLGRGLNLEEFKEKIKTTYNLNDFNSLSKRQASQVIDSLQRMAVSNQ